MQLAAELTLGWEEVSSASTAALSLHQHAAQAPNYEVALANQLLALGSNLEILALERLFRKNPKGFKPIRQFVSTLALLPAWAGCPQPVICHIDAFAYAFLRGAKNFDLILPLAIGKQNDFYQTYRQWTYIFKVLENFERTGTPLPGTIEITRQQYLALRQVVSRPSARDELRALATLLVSGPSTLDQISEDLGLNYTLGQRSLAVFETIGVIQRSQADLFVIPKSTLPLVMFCLRETLGFDLLSSLPFMP